MKDALIPGVAGLAICALAIAGFEPNPEPKYAHTNLPELAASQDDPGERAKRVRGKR